jgi:hypothetical protein
MANSDKFLLDIRSRIEYFRHEFKLTYSEAIGVLRMLSYELEKEAFDAATEDADSD